MGPDTVFAVLLGYDIFERRELPGSYPFTKPVKDAKIITNRGARRALFEAT
jgi:hypothetical protein